MARELSHPPSRRSDVTNLLILGAVTAGARLAYAAVLPARLYSTDIHIWETVSSILQRGENPYATTPLLYYPPFWMQTLYFLGRLSVHTHVSLAHWIQAFLTGVDVCIVVLTYAFLRYLGLGARAFWIALIGIALNPISILMAIQHGNFDAMVGLFALGAVFGLVAWSRGAPASSLLLACLSLGLGILAKTVPLILTPLLLVRWREADWGTRIVGLALVVLPTAVGFSVLYALAPHQVAADILQYRSAAGYFGVSGLLSYVGGAPLTTRYGEVYVLLALAVVLGSAILIARPRRVEPGTIVLASVLLLMWIPAFGSGYGAQYIGWFLPLTVVLFATSAGPLRASVAAFGVVALLTYLFEYAYIPNTDPATHAALAPGTASTLYRLPLFLAYVLVIAVGVWTLASGRGDVRGPDRVVGPALE